mgnify:FL=1
MVEEVQAFMTPDTLIKIMMETTENWKKVTRYVEEVTKNHEVEERRREKAGRVTDKNGNGN